jgi:RNA 3'-terminal phosphate cyclase (ATP)
VDALETFLETNGAVDPYLADQLLLPLAFASGPSQLRPSKVTSHLITNAAIIEQFTDAQILIHGRQGQTAAVEIRPSSADV